ncbi:LLM class flavin-dependent oxidoreductase (plasmid) [Rhodococcus oxybenzonivorans]|uniref:LLM class flavin-dependent oxidoreductase n=1 Tax=Rhodococcus oxybenzonivorans TaxID=1990687 RepID=A0A2S2C5X4_9NOCA|nr:LLM class flavin-dependent oxidoreductase [Rhodococcus oxybenzonivorans]AWK76265.1 LLM class flavin-dependent oxidoreductase [Rhodococcus oxybenzonivorans]
MAKQLIFNIFTLNSVSHIFHGMWRHPDSKALQHNDLDTWLELARLAERGCIDTIFIADLAGQQGVYRGSTDMLAERGINFPVSDPEMLLSAMIATTENLGFVYTRSMIQQPPFSFARAASTLDHLSKGRVGWNIVTSYLENAYLNVGHTELTDHDERYRRAQEYMEVVYKLWEGSWEDDAIIADREKGIFADPSKIHRIDHVGEHYSVQGPHLVEPSPQRTPVLFQAGASEAGRDFASRHAEGIFLMADSPADAAAFIDDVRARLVAAGRQPDDAKFIAGTSIIVGSTEEEAERKAAELDEYVDGESLLAQYSGVFGADLAALAPDMPLAELAQQTSAVRGILEMFIDRLPADSNPTVADLGKYFSSQYRIVGTPESIADTLQAWADAGVDGFNIIQMTTPGTYTEFIDHVVPVLQARGMMKREYAPGTLREKLFPGRAARLNDRHPTQGYRKTTMPV